jgi:Peptidase A4 family
MHRRHPSFRLRALLAGVPMAALVLTGTVGTASAAHTPVNSQTALRLAVQRLLAHWHPTNHAIGRISLKQVTSTNWSGYADTGTGFSSVTAKWAQPKVSNCSTSGPVKATVFWVGIDGFSSSSVEQDGTGALCGQGTPLTYFTWWEMFPTNNIQVVGTTVKPGDNISASVVRSGTKYTLKVTDSTTSGNNITTTQTCQVSGGCKNSSAEWIGERPSSSTGPLPLAQFSTWTVTAATVKAGTKSGTIKTFPDNAITMINNPTAKKVLAKPGPLNSAGNSFMDVWKASS